LQLKSRNDIFDTVCVKKERRKGNKEFEANEGIKEKLSDGASIVGPYVYIRARIHFVAPDKKMQSRSLG
jgi:hypothetical protein